MIGTSAAKAKYDLNCLVCGVPFQAGRRDARACSNRCTKRLQRGGRVPEIAAMKADSPPNTPNDDLGHDLPAPRYRETPSERTYAIYRALGSRPEMFAIDHRGRIKSGAFSGVTIGDLLRTAARQGWLAYRHRPDGWYSAEWCSERKTIALCGPCELPGASATSAPAMAA